MRISDKRYCWLPIIIGNISFVFPHVLCMTLYFLAYKNTIPNNLDHIVRHSEFHRNCKECKYNEQLLIRMNNCEIISVA